MVGEAVLPQSGIAGGDIEAHHAADFEEREQTRAHPIRNGSLADSVALRQQSFIGEAPIRGSDFSSVHKFLSDLKIVSSGCRNRRHRKKSVCRGACRE